MGSEAKVSNKQRVLVLLKRHSRRGVSALDFPTGFRLAARIHELRCKGHPIDTDMRVKPAVYRLSPDNHLVVNVTPR
jgi:hypothetical protein